MERLRYTKEAEWSALIRHWYQACDEAGVSVDQRLDWFLSTGDHLMAFLRLGQFPPPGKYVAGLPIAQHEGILTNVDRRLQLYDMVQQGTYNNRSISSLDSENFFGAFQVCVKIEFSAVDVTTAATVFKIDNVRYHSEIFLRRKCNFNYSFANRMICIPIVNKHPKAGVLQNFNKFDSIQLDPWRNTF